MTKILTDDRVDAIACLVHCKLNSGLSEIFQLIVESHRSLRTHFCTMADVVGAYVDENALLKSRIEELEKLRGEHEST